MTEEERRKLEQMLSTIRLQNRRHQTEVWKVGLACIAVTAAVVQAANLIFG